jgi:serine/threonine protein kinase
MNTMQHCPNCGATLPADAPAGLCPVCLLKTKPPGTSPDEGTSGGPAPTITVKPMPQRASAEPASTLTISPAAFERVHYFGDYELLEEIARGGMGVVYKARQVSLNRTVALKMILAGKLASEAEVQRFRREAEAAANLQHPNIVAIHEVGEHEGQHYYTMDYVAGRDLGALVRESGPLPPARAAECVKTLAEAVHFAHQRGTLHRDLKPQNVLIDAAGVPHIADFGLAKIVERDESLTHDGVAMGSPSYMPPEQAAGRLDQVGPHSDVYSLGAILYELLTGRPPFRAETPVATMRQVMESEPAAPRKLNASLPPDLETICLKCLEKNPARRYHSARALAEELGRFLNHEPIQAIPVSAVRKAETWLRRHPWTLVAAASSVSMALLGLLYWQFERGKFLENQLLANQALLHPGSMAKESIAWEVVGLLLILTMVWALGAFKESELGVPNSVVNLGHVDIRTFLSAVFRQYVRGEKGDLPGRLAGWSSPPKPVSRRLRVVGGLTSVAGLGFAVIYLAKIIQFSVWANTPTRPEWLWAAVGLDWVGFTLSLMLLFHVVRDYQKFVYGTPSRNLSAQQSEALRQAILVGDIPGAIKLYRQTFPDASRVDAGLFVETLNQELRAKRPQEFSPFKLRDLNWVAMSITLVLELVAFAIFWLVMPSIPHGAKLFACAAGFLFGAGWIFLILVLNQKPYWSPLALASGLITIPALSHLFSSRVAFFGAVALGILFVQAGSRRGRKSPPGKGPSEDASSPQ